MRDRLELDIVDNRYSGEEAGRSTSPGFRCLVAEIRCLSGADVSWALTISTIACLSKRELVDSPSTVAAKETDDEGYYTVAIRRRSLSRLGVPIHEQRPKCSFDP